MFGVEPICRVLTSHGLKIATSTYYAAKNRTPSTRTVRDTELKTQISRVHTDNFSVYGARKVWRQLHREGIPVARCTVARLMRDLGLEGVRRGKKIRTTVRDDGPDRAADLLQRDFTASRPNERWVADFTYVATWSGIVYVAFVVDLFSRAIVGWSAATSKPPKVVLNALGMALWRRDRSGTPLDRASFIIRMPAANTRLSRSPRTSSRRVSTPPRSAPSATPWTTRSWNPRSASTRQS
ncbi:transposase InsO family protein [Streptomyces sp. V4I8]